MQDRKFIPQIEAMRGLAALAVASYHIGGYFDKAAYADGGFDAFFMKIWMGFSNGYGAVVAFFVMSGFVLAGSLDRNADPVRFVYNRIFRLFPAVIFAILLFTILYQLYGLDTYGASFDPVNVLLNMLMVHTDIDRVMWSMKIECAAVPLIWISVWLYERSGSSRPLWAAMGVLFGLSFVGAYSQALGDGSNLAPLYAFLAGILVHFRGSRLVRRLDAKWVNPAALLLAFAFCFSGLLKQAPQTGWIILVECISAALLVALIVWHPRALVFRPLDLPIVKFYGRISYSFYLLHPLSFFLVRRGFELRQFIPNAPATVLAILTFLLSVLLMTPLAYLSWRYVELPGVALGRAISGRRFKALA